MINDVQCTSIPVQCSTTPGQSLLYKSLINITFHFEVPLGVSILLPALAAKEIKKW